MSRYKAAGPQGEFEPGSSDQVLANKLGITDPAEMAEVELILIHPFRDGNGRLARLLADVMAAQSGRGPLDYASWDAEKSRYFGAIKKGLDRSYTTMETLVKQALT